MMLCFLDLPEFFLKHVCFVEPPAPAVLIVGVGSHMLMQYAE